MQDQPIYLVPIVDILVSDRFRTELEGYQANEKIKFLAESITKHGLFHPLILAREDNRLIAGGRRLSALISLGWTLAPVIYKDQLTEIQRKEIELEENIARKDLIWQESARLTRAIDDLKRQIYGSNSTGGGSTWQTTSDGTIERTSNDLPPEESGWSLRKTADFTGDNVAIVHRKIVLANALDVLPSLDNEKSPANALRKVDHLIEDLEREIEFRANQQTVQQFESSILLGDSIDLIASVADNSVDCIITDPPYGLGLEKGRFAARDSTDTRFSDTPDTVLVLLEKLLPNLRRVLKPSGHLYAFFGAALWKETLDLYQKHGFGVSEIICIWYKIGAQTGAGDWDHSFAPSWEPFLFATNRTRRLAGKHKNVFEAEAPSGDERYHPTQKPLSLLKELIELSTNENELIFDPFAGSGSVLVAANHLNRKYLGFELDDRYVQITKQRLLELTKCQNDRTEQITPYTNQ